MSKDYNLIIAQELKVKPSQVQATSQLLDDHATVPFIARYRKEITGNLDEVAIAAIRDRLTQLRDLDKRRVVVISSIQEQGKLTGPLKEKILAAETMSVLEDLYLPYRPKKRTRATDAKEKGLEPLAKMIFEQKGIDVEKEAVSFVDASKKVNSTDEALAGARDIIAEWISENSETRAKLRKLYQEDGKLTSKVIRGKEKEAINYKDYYEWQELAAKAPSHRILAIRRGEKESFLMSKIVIEEENVLRILTEQFIKGKGDDSRQVGLALSDGFKRLMSVSLETEYRIELKKRADLEAIQIFSDNLRQLLMAPPLGQKNILAIDPGQRTGCKIVCLDSQGKFLLNTTIYLFSSEDQQKEAVEIVQKLCQKFNIEVIAIGNGTASRETEKFIKDCKLDKAIKTVIVSESGASIYSASDLAREEFPDQDVTVCGAVSIGRRLMDPLSELVKIDPTSIGVGQYQHDFDQSLLKNCLDDIVISCVNQVGVELNSASKQLLIYVSGIGPTRAQAIIDYRNSHGAFASREELRSVAGLGPKAFEQAAGFLRIRGAENLLDSSSVHPESYNVVEKMAQDLNVSLKDLMTHENLRKKIDLQKYITDTIGLPTLTDIKNELAKPGRDPREPFVLFSYKEGIERIEDLKVGLKLPGVVTNVTAFGCFVDIGVHQDGLVHISQLADHFVKNPNYLVKVHQKVDVTVLEIDIERNRIALSMRKKIG